MWLTVNTLKVCNIIQYQINTIIEMCLFLSVVFCGPYEFISCGTTSNSGGRTIGAKVTYTPANNAMLIGPSVITCERGGKWSSPMPTCRSKLL